MVLLPGMDGTGALFSEFLSLLEGEVRPIVVSYPQDQPLGYRELAEFARAFLPVDVPYFLLGESFSGPVAIALAAERPGGLKGLILSCTYVSNPHPWLRPLKGLIGMLPITAKLSWMTAPLLFGRFSSPALRRSLRQALEHVHAKTIRTRLREVLEVNYSEKLERVEVPILYLQALEDWVVPASALRRIAGLRCVEVVAVRGPHLLLQAVPREVAVRVKKFISSRHLGGVGS